MSFLYTKNVEKICLKLTGESLMGEGESLSHSSMLYIAEQVAAILNEGKKLCIVVGGGNIYRGVKGSVQSGIRQDMADYIGMLATVMNTLALSDVFIHKGMSVDIFSSFSIAGVVPEFNLTQAKKSFNEGKVILFCAGLGHPYFTTDTASVLRALEMDADILLKGTKVDGIYTSDPYFDPQAKKLDTVSYNEVITNRYNVMDMSAFLLCQEKNLPIVVFDFFNPSSLGNFLKGKIQGTLVTNDNSI